MQNSERIAWFEAAIPLLRRRFVEDFPDGVSLSIGWPNKKRSGQFMSYSDVVFDALDEHGEGFAAGHVITLHPVVLQDAILGLASLLCEMIRISVGQEDARKKPFKDRAKTVGFCEPWARPEADETLRNALRSIALQLDEELGYTPFGRFVPPPEKPKKPSSILKYECSCLPPRVLRISPVKMDPPLICPTCEDPLRPTEVRDQRQDPGYDEHGHR